ncbi:MAG: peroxidase [Ilumatobacter sp.]|uniref:peroxidase family protein n=1 Tax=Ilumatobacter sp. TaxID=1967498 RepID=UPI003753B1D4|nr:peroxidase [Ilumatobacter sp.]
MSLHQTPDSQPSGMASIDVNVDEPTAIPPPSRRAFLSLIGAGLGAAVAAPSIATAQRADDGGRRERRRPDREGPDTRGDRNRDGGGTGGVSVDGPDRFGRIFDLPPFAEPSIELRAALIEMGRPGGMMDANDPLEVGPIRLITEPELSPNNRDNPANTAGVTFLGQFLDHDITRDAGSRLGRATSARGSTNLRSARFDLDSVYGGGPEQSPELYEGFRLRIESGGQFEDLPRDDDGTAILGDDRNDENMMLAGLQCAFIMFHNAVLASISASTATAVDFADAQRIVRRHYQWIIVHEVLPQFVGQEMVDSIVNSGRQVFTPNVARIPLEFQTAAYRFGHSMVRPSYRANLAGDEGEPFFAFVFDPKTFGDDDPDDLTGRSRAARRFIGWQTFFDFGDGEVKPNKRIDAVMSTPLFQLPMFSIPTARGEDIGPTSLATRNLLRHITWQIPSGQRIAAEMGVDLLSAADLSQVGQLGANLDQSTPLFYYLLREADVVADGLHLGPCGGRIVGEVFMALIEQDPDSYLNATAANGGVWSPSLPQRNGQVGDDFTMADLLTIAGVDPDSRGQ